MKGYTRYWFAIVITNFANVLPVQAATLPERPVAAF